MLDAYIIDSIRRRQEEDRVGGRAGIDIRDIHRQKWEEEERRREEIPRPDPYGEEVDPGIVDLEIWDRRSQIASSISAAAS